MRRALLGALLAALLLGAAPPETKPAAAELVFRHGGVYTVDATRSWAEAAAVSGGRIVFVGTDAEAARWIGPKTRVVDLTGKMLLPGFHDSHAHPISGGIDSLEVDLHGLGTPEEVLAKIRAYAAAHPKAAWVRERGGS